MATNEHYKYLSNDKYKKLKELSRLKLEDIKNSIWSKEYKILAYCYYGYYKELNNYSLNDLLYIKFNMYLINNLNSFKFFESRGLNNNYNHIWSYCLLYNSYKITKYIESFNPDMGNINPFNHIWASNYKLKFYKKIYKSGFNINIRTLDRNLFIQEILYSKNNKKIKYLISKGINIYTKYNGDNPCQLAQVCLKQHRIKCIKSLYIRWYCACKLFYIGGYSGHL
jgi:hypothetical protein